MEKMVQGAFINLLERHDIRHSAIDEGASPSASGQIELLDMELAGITLKNADLACSALIRCVISNSKFASCNFSSALMMETKFIECEFHECSFVKTSLQDATARVSIFDKCKFIKADFSNGDFNGCDFSGSDLSWSLIVEADFRNTNLRGTHLNGSRMYRSKLYNPVRQKVAEAKDITFQDIDISLKGNGSRLIQADGMKQIFDI